MVLFENQCTTIINVVGVGRVSSSLAKVLKRRFEQEAIGPDQMRFGYVVSRDREKAAKLANELGGVPVTYEDKFNLDGVVLFGLNDTVLPSAQRLLGGRVGRVVAIHFSGYHPSTIFPSEWSPVSMHPNVAVAGEGTTFEGVIFGIEGSVEGVSVAKRLVEMLRANYVIVETDKKAYYHLAAVLVSNLPFALYALARELHNIAGIEKDYSELIIGTLVDAVAQNIKGRGLEKALTGPVSRGDWEVVESEGRLFRNRFPQYSALYDKSVEILRNLMASAQADQTKIADQ